MTFCCNMGIGIGIAMPALGGVLPAEGDPAPDFLVNYRMDGTDANLTRVGVDDFRIGKECPDAIGSFFNQVNYNTAVPDSSIWGQIGSGPFSISVWLSSETSGINRGIFSTGSGGASGVADTVRLRFTGGGNFQFRTNGTTVSSTSDQDDGTIKHYVMVSDGSGQQVRFYIDGVLNNTGTMPTYNIVDTNKFFIGAQDGGSSIFDGLIDGVRVYDRGLTPDEITGLANYTCDYNPSQITTVSHHDPSNLTTITEAAGLVSQVDDIGTTATEHLVQATGANQMSTGLQDINGLNVLSSTTADRFMNDLSYPIPASGNITISFVAQIDGQTASTAASLIAMDSATNDWQLNSGNTTQFDGSLNSSGIGGSDPLTGGPFTGPDIWTLVFNFDGSVKKVYVNGVERSSGTYTTKLDSSQKLRIFSNRGATAFVYGLFGEMTISEDVTDAQRQLDEGYLAWKWFPTTTAGGNNPKLPAGHTYLTEPPKEA